jgi:hypothetical protein
MGDKLLYSVAFTRFANDVSTLVAGLRREESSALRRAHKLAMAAKILVFRAQDEAGFVQVSGAKTLRGRLTRIRSSIEALDRTIRALKSWPRS